MSHAIAIAAPGQITSAAHTLTPQELDFLCARAAALPPVAIRELFASYAGALEAVSIFTGAPRTYWQLAELLGELERKYPADEPSALRLQPSAV